MLLFLTDTQQDCERRIEELLYSMPQNNVSLDRFMQEYEKKFGTKLSSFYGHSKLIKLLEDMPNTIEVGTYYAECFVHIQQPALCLHNSCTFNFTTVFIQIKGTGASRLICLHPVKLLTREMVVLLSSRSAGLPINMVVPTYKEVFGRDFQATHYGFPKLIRALEAIPDTVDVRLNNY